LKAQLGQVADGDQFLPDLGLRGPPDEIADGDSVAVGDVGERHGLVEEVAEDQVFEGDGDGGAGGGVWNGGGFHAVIVWSNRRKARSGARMTAI